MKTSDVIRDITALKNKKKTWPGCFNYDYKNNMVIIEFTKAVDKHNFRRLDPWAFAVIEEIKSKSESKVNGVVFDLNINNDLLNKNRLNYEAFLRRVSILNILNEELLFKINMRGQEVVLYSIDSLLNAPQNEVVRKSVRPKKKEEEDTGKLEKDLQTFLFRQNTSKTNERLAIFGDDFKEMNKLKKEFKIKREFPTCSFYKKVSDSTRILPTEFIDFVTLNRYGKLSIVELKLDSSPLEVISQLLDYSLFVRCYFKQLKPLIENELSHSVKMPFIGYLVSNTFHKRMPGILKYYGFTSAIFGFELKQVTLGHTLAISEITN